jgi:hypothetical protein
MLRVFPCRDLLPQSLPHVELVGVGTVIVILADDADRLA